MMDPASLEPCVWSVDYSEDTLWKTACGETWIFTEDGPEENNVRFCPGCGHPVKMEEVEG